MKSKPQQHQPQPRQRDNFLAWLAMAAAIAVLLRLFAGAGLSHCPAATSPLDVTDMATYRTLALQIRAGQWPSYFDYQPFYYTVFLPIAYIFSPDGGVWPVIILQALLGGCTVWLTGLSAARLFGRKAGLLAAVLLAFSRFHIFYSSFLLLEVWFSFWCAAVLYLSIRMIDRQARWHTGLLLGVCCAGALLTRGSALLWIPGIIALPIWKHRREWRKLAVLLACFIIGFVAPLTPYSIHNSRHFGRFCGPSVAGGKVMVLGNTPEAPAGGLEYPRSYVQWCEEAESGRRGVLSNIFGWAAREPGAFLELELRKILLFWDHTEIPNNISYENEGAYSHLLPWMLPWAVLGTLGLAGLLLALSHPQLRHAPLLWMTAAYWMATAAFYILARFRIGFLPLLCICASLALERIWHARKATRTRPRLALALCVALFTVMFAYDRYCQFFEAPLYRVLRPDGLTLTFDNETVIYDHGPMLTAEAFTVTWENSDVELQKTFRPGDAVKALSSAGDECRQQLWLRILLMSNNTVNFTTLSTSTMLLNGHPLQTRASLQRNLNVDWLVLEFTAPPPQAGADTEFKVRLPADCRQKLIFDKHREYGRTTIVDGREEKPMDAEAIAEWVIPH